MASTNVRPAKIGRPRLDRVLLRERLFERLDAYADRPLTWLSAPAGAGKTLLANSYVQARGLRCLWYQLDADDADPATFFYYLGLAAQAAAPRKRNALPLFTPEYRSGIAAFTRRFLAQVYDRLPASAVIVFDNFEQLPEGALLHEVLPDALAALPAGRRMLVASRTDPPPALARERAQGTIAVLDAQEMRLSLAEAEGLSAVRADRGDPIVPAAVVRTLQDRSQGWAAGLVLLLEQARRPPEEQQLPAGPVPELVFDYFAHELFMQAPAEVRDFLLRTALPPRFTADVAASLTGYPRSARLLHRLMRDNLFTTRMEGDPPVYHYHPLFRDFLLQRVQEALPPAEVETLQREAALALADSGDYEAAAHLLRACGAWDALAELVCAHAETVLNQGRFQTVAEWVQSIPATVRERAPWLLYWLGCAQLPTDPARSRGSLGSALAGFERDGDVDGAFLTAVKAIESTFWDWDDFVPLDEWIHTLRRLLEDQRQQLDPALEWRVASAMAQAMIMRVPFDPELPYWTDRVNAIVLGHPQLLEHVVITFVEFSYFLMRGDHAGMRMVMDALRPHAENPRIPPLARIFWLSNVAAEAYYRLDNTAALQAVDEGLALAQESGVHTRDNCFLDSGFKAALSARDVPLAESYLERMRPFAGGNVGFYTLRFHRNRSQLAFHNGDLAAAARHVERAVTFSAARGFEFHRIDCLIGQAMVLAQQGAWAEAQRTLRDLTRAAYRMGNPYLEFTALFGRIALALERRRSPLMQHLLRRMMALGRTHGLHYLEWWQPRQLVRICALALEQGIEPAYARELIARYRLAPPEDERPEAWPWALRIQVFGTASVTTEEGPIRFTGKAQQRPLELLQMLIVLGGRDVPQSRLCELLWPDADGDAALSSFNVTLHRLRRLVGNDALTLSNRRLTLQRDACWVDLWAFDAALERAHKALARRDLPDALEAFEQASRLSRVALLAGDEQYEPYLSTSRRIEDAFCRCAASLGEALLSDGQAEHAVQCFERGLGVSPEQERLHQGAIRGWLALGRHGEAEAAYRRCRNDLAAHLGVPPSPETEALRAAIARETRA